MRRAARPVAFGIGVVPLLMGLSTSGSEAANCAYPSFAPYLERIRPLPQEALVRSHGSGDPMAPPSDPDVGDEWLWYTWKLAGFPVAEQKLCTVRGEGQHVYVVVENSQWQTRVFQDDVDRIVQMWDQQSLGAFPTQGIYDLDTQNFGPAPDELDNDPKIYVLYYDFDVTSDGFFWPFDEFPDGSQDFASNECEVLYMNSSDFDPGGDYLIAVQAHEFQHAIHWLGDEDELAWVNEGCSELAMWLFGRPDQLTAFPSNPDNNVTSWNGNFADYVKTYLFYLYFYEQYGGQPTILHLVSNPQNSIQGVQSTLAARGYSDTFAQVVRDWTTANYLDDPTVGGGRYNYVGEDLPSFAAVTKSSYPVPPTNASVNHYAADYVKFVNGTPQRLTFDGGDTSDWSARVIKFSGATPLSVQDISLDGLDAGFFDLHQFGTAYDQAVLQVTNISSSGLLSYQYRTDAVPAAIGDEPALEAPLALEPSGAQPIADRAVLRLRAAGEGLVDLEIRAVDGRLVHAEQTWRPAGESEIAWDLDAAGSATVASGVYFARVRAHDGAVATTRFVVVR